MDPVTLPCEPLERPDPAVLVAAERLARRVCRGKKTKAHSRALAHVARTLAPLLRRRGPDFALWTLAEVIVRCAGHIDPDLFRGLCQTYQTGCRVRSEQL